MSFGPSTGSSWASPPEEKPSTRKRRPWVEYLLAILGGNIVYLLLVPYLPAPLQHQIFRVDLGLGLDFLICAGLYALIRWGRKALGRK